MEGPAVTEPTRDALHAETLAYLAVEFQLAAQRAKRKRSSEPIRRAHEKVANKLAHAAACVKRVPELEAEVERMRAKAAIVDAMERGEVRIIGWSDDRTRFGLLVDTPDGGEDEVTGPSVLAAYAAATREGTDATK